jgi:hypothetical protein
MDQSQTLRAAAKVLPVAHRSEKHCEAKDNKWKSIEFTTSEYHQTIPVHLLLLFDKLMIL